MFYQLLFIILLSLHHAIISQAIEYYLALDSKSSDVVADINSTFVDLICPPTHPIWFVPRTSVDPKHTTGNRLRIDLDKIEKRPLQRGYYTCCPRKRARFPDIAIQRVQTPSCCPCCSWPEDEYCSHNLWNTSTLSTAPSCLQVFLYTSMSSCPETTLNLPWKSKVLVPCPAPLPDSHLRIYSQLGSIKRSRDLWFNSANSSDSVDFSKMGMSHFDPKIGVCTTNQTVLQRHTHLICFYPKSKCVVKLRGPLAPPTILPTVTCRILPIKQNFSMHTSIIPRFRVFEKQNLTISCTASYFNVFVANKLPTLCYRWRVSTESTQSPVSSWSRHNCFITKKIGENVAYATDILNLTTKHVSMRVDVEISEWNRAMEDQNFSIRFLVSPSTKFNEMTVNILYPDDRSTYNILKNNATGNQTVLLLDKSLKHLKIGFYALNEITAETFCSSPSLGKEHIRFNRAVDRWVCNVTLPAHKFELILHQGNLETFVTVYPSPNSLLPRSTILGLRGSVDAPINVSCPAIENHLPSLFNTTVDRIHWFVYRGDELSEQTYTNESNLLIPPLINSTVQVEPILEWSLPSKSSIKQFLLKLSSLSLPPVRVFSRQLCVVCQTFFTVGGSTTSNKECITLEAKKEPTEYNLSIFEAGSLRFLPTFAPIQVSRVSNPSFRITTAYPVSRLVRNGSLSYLSVYEGSDIELRCSVSRINESTLWPIISFRDVYGNDSLPNGTLQLYALAFTLESRLRMNTSVVQSSGAYVCGSYKEDAVPLIVDVVSSKVPEIVEPNQPVRYFTANEIVRLTCRAIGGPGPIIKWRLVNGTQKDNNILLKWCYESHSKEENSCSLLYIPPPQTENVTIICEALNYIGIDTFSLSLIRISTANELTGNALFSRLWKNYMFWIIVPLVMVICFLVCLGTCLWRKGKQVMKAEKLIKMDNLIYGYPNKMANNFAPFYQEELFSLMPTEELRDRWCIDRHDLRPFSQPLGNGHYGTVQKGIYNGSGDKDKKRTNAFFVALKSPSSEMASLSCFRNEIIHLMKLSDGPNIVKMIGCAFGERGDLSDTLLVLEFCPNSSLSNFIRRMLYPRGCYDNRPMFVRNTEGGISTASTQISTTPSPTSDGSVSKFFWEACNSPARIILNDYEERSTSEPKSRSSKRRRQRGGRRNTALVYQRLTRNSSSIFLQIAVGISRGLEYLAQNSVIHRDLATRNILLDSRFEPKICDFGLAVTVDTQQDCSNGPCHPSNACYHIITFSKQLPFRILPPEALSKQLFYLSSDIWEFGLLLWQMFFFETKKPFENVQNSDALLRLLSSNRGQANDFLNYVTPEGREGENQSPLTIDRPPAIPDSLWSVICDCLKFQASDRPSASEIRQRLDDCYSSYEEISEAFTVPDQNGNYHRLCRRVPSQVNVFESDLLHDAFDDPIPQLVTYENIEHARNSYGCLESFPSSSI
ncbi:unnamed protein product [Rodentolepis nana]|uniref:receptor protein-tyrosine kinase n=1 Tax=Rodentolepis nana TaxID=102285 RepID=A0A0R3TYN6_RODNA|nr:unnamed protein product [Rodentolepis nana]